MIRVRPAEYVAGISMGLVFLLPLLAYGGFDTEETALGIFSSQVHYQHLAHGSWLYWFNDLGFGTPMPIGHRLDAHPAFALSAVASLRVALSALWIVQMMVAVVYFLRLAALTGLRPPLRLVLLACYVFSVVSVCWLYENDWVTFVIGWTLYPALVLYLHEAIRAEASPRRWPALVKLGLVVGFLVLNSHPGYVAPLATTLVVYAVVAAPRTLRMYAGFVAAFLLCLAVTAERLYYFASEATMFPTMDRYSQPAYRFTEYLSAFVVPLIPADGNMRLPFVGAVLLVAAFASLAWYRDGTSSHVRACTVAFATAFVLSLIPPKMLSLWTGSSGSWLFRDPVVFFGLLAGGLVLQRGFEHTRAGVRWLTIALVALQAGQQATAIWPGVQEYWARRESLLFYRYQTEPFGIVKSIERHVATYGRRLYLSESVQALARTALSPYGIHVVTDLSLHGLNPVNAWFKVVSMDRLYPSIGFMHGNIGGQRDVIDNAALLDVLGINMMLMTEAEGAVPAGLPVLERIPVSTIRGDHVLLLLGNPGAWPRATMLSAGAESLTLPQRPACPNERALCRDFAPLMATRVGDVTSMTEENGAYSVRVTPGDRERLLFLSATYRPEWRASSPGGALPVIPVADAFIGVTVPPGTERIDLAFTPGWRIRLAWLSGLSTMSAILFLGVDAWRSR